MERLFKARTFWLCLKARTLWLRLIGRKLTSLKRGEVVQVVVGFGVVGLRRVDEEQARPPETAEGCKAVHVVVAKGVVGFVGVDDKQSGSPERALHFVITIRLKVRTIWSRLIERKLNSLERDEVVQAELQRN